MDSDSDNTTEKKTMTVDRIEGDIAVIERGLGDMIDVAVSELPDGVREGSVLTYDGQAWEIDEAQEADRRALIEQLKRSLFKHKE